MTDYVFDDIRTPTGARDLVLDQVRALLPNVCIAQDGADLLSHGFERRLRPAPSKAEACATLAAAMIERVEAIRERREDGGFLFPAVTGVHYQSRPKDRENIAGAAISAEGSVRAGALAGNLLWADGVNNFGWIATDNSVTPMDAHTMWAFYKRGSALKTALVFHGRGLKEAIRAKRDAGDLAGLQAMDPTLESGWPE